MVILLSKFTELSKYRENTSYFSSCQVTSGLQGICLYLSHSSHLPCSSLSLVSIQPAPLHVSACECKRSTVLQTIRSIFSLRNYNSSNNQCEILPQELYCSHCGVLWLSKGFDMYFQKQAELLFSRIPISATYVGPCQPAITSSFC